jgi:uncharacterized membrane protein
MGTAIQDNSFEESSTAAGPKLSNANISAITGMEKAALDSRTAGERIGDAIARQAGRSWFIALHGVWFIAWIILNAGIVPWLHPFDPYPYQFLTFVVSLEAIFLSLFILMSQNRGARQADERAHLDLQINLLSEQESTKMLEMLQSLCEYHGIAKAKDPEMEKLMMATKPEELLKELKANLPESC